MAIVNPNMGSGFALCVAAGVQSASNESRVVVTLLHSRSAQNAKVRPLSLSIERHMKTSHVQRPRSNKSVNGTPKRCAFGFPRLRLGARYFQR